MQIQAILPQTPCFSAGLLSISQALAAAPCTGKEAGPLCTEPLCFTVLLAAVLWLVPLPSPPQMSSASGRLASVTEYDKSIAIEGQPCASEQAVSSLLTAARVLGAFLDRTC